MQRLAQPPAQQCHLLGRRGLGWIDLFGGDAVHQRLVALAGVPDVHQVPDQPRQQAGPDDPTPRELGLQRAGDADGEQRPEEPHHQPQQQHSEQRRQPAAADDAGIEGLHGSLDVLSSTISVRRLRSRPSALVLGASGSASPLPAALHRAIGGKLRGQHLGHRLGARLRQLPVGGEPNRADRLVVGVAVHQHVARLVAHRLADPGQQRHGSSGSTPPSRRRTWCG